MKENALTKKARTIMTWVLAVYFLTVAVNLGEFWPFSIYPMFSQGGKTWSRSLVREYPDSTAYTWEATSLSSLPGHPVSVRALGVDPIDLANFVSKTTVWDSVRVAALERMLFGRNEPDRRLMVFKVQGSLEDDGGVNIMATPYVFITPEIDHVNPVLAP